MFVFKKTPKYWSLTSLTCFEMVLSVMEFRQRSFLVLSLTHVNTLLTYTALRAWDFSPYLSRAELRLEKNGMKVAEAEYHLRGKGGYSLMKWEGTKSKMDPVIEQLLKGY